jgi:hypothetical protein
MLSMTCKQTATVSALCCGTQNTYCDTGLTLSFLCATGLPPHLAKLPAWQLDQVPLDLLGETARPSGKRGAGATDAGGADVLVKREGSPSGTRGQHHQGHAADAGHIPGAVLLPDGVLLVVSGVNIDTDKKWRHAGGPEEWRVGDWGRTSLGVCLG